MKVLHPVRHQICKAQQWPQDWKRSVFIPVPKKGNAKEYSSYCIIALILPTSKVMLKILQAGQEAYMNQELPDVQAEFRKGRGTRDQIANICWIIEKARKFQKKHLLYFIDYTKTFYWVDHNKLENSSRVGNIRPPNLPPVKPLCRSRATVRTGHGIMDWFKIGKGVCQGCILLSCLFNFFAEYIM